MSFFTLSCMKFSTVFFFYVLVLVCLLFISGFCLFFLFSFFGFILYVGCAFFSWFFLTFYWFFGLFSSFWLCFLLGFYFFLFLFRFYVFSAFEACFSLGAELGFFFFVLFFEHHLQAHLWLLVTPTCGAWRYRYRGHWRSGARRLSTRSRVYAQEWHRKDFHSHIHSHPIMHTPKTKSKTLNSPNMTPSFSCPLPVQCGGGRRPGSLADAPQHCSNVGGLLV